MIEPAAPIDPMTATEVRLPGHWVSEEAQLRFFEDALQCAREAEQKAGARVHWIELAGTRIELRFSGTALAKRFFPALAHLEEDESAACPDLVLHVWDSAGSGIVMPPPPCKHECFTDRGDIWGMASPRIRSAFHWSEFSVNLLDVQRRVGIFWVRDEAELPYWTTGSPLRTLFHWWMEMNGGQLLHAAAVGTKNGAMLITGKGGVGKSSSALSCLQAGLEYLADDYLVVTLEPTPRVWSLYSTAKLAPDQMGRYPALAQYIANPGFAPNEKAVLRLFPAFARQTARSLPLRVLGTPTFAPTPETGVAPADAVRLERAASFTTMSQLPHAGRGTHDFIHRMVAAVPGLELRLGQDRDRVPERIVAVLEQTDLALRQLSAPTCGAVAAGGDLISVIIPVFNGARFLPEAVRSVLAQGYPSIEVIVVDDGSTDDIASVVPGLPVEVRYFRQDNAGPASARNRGIKDAAGDLIAFLDVDDLWPDDNLRRLAEALRRDPALDLVHGHAQVTRSAAGAGIGEFLSNPKESYPTYIGAGLYRRRAFETVGLFDAELRYGEDSDWFMRAEECGLRAERVDEVTLYVRRHDGNMTRGKTLVERNLLRVIKKQIARAKKGQG